MTEATSRWFTLVCLVLAVCGCQPPATDVKSAERFVQQTYHRYEAPAPGPDTLRADAPQLFSAALLALIRDDQRIADGEIGLLNHDPICACQDTQGFQLMEAKVTSSGENKAIGNVTFRNGGKAVHVRLSLLRESSAWRIDDIEEPDVPSLRRYLSEGLAELKSAR